MRNVPSNIHLLCLLIKTKHHKGKTSERLYFQGELVQARVFKIQLKFDHLNIFLREAEHFWSNVVERLIRSFLVYYCLEGAFECTSRTVHYSFLSIWKLEQNYWSLSALFSVFDNSRKVLTTFSNLMIWERESCLRTVACLLLTN